MLKAKRITMGIFAALLGVAGAILPVMPGWPFFVFAIFILSRDIPPVRPLRNWLLAKYPRILLPIERWEARLGLIEKPT